MQPVRVRQKLVLSSLHHSSIFLWTVGFNWLTCRTVTPVLRVRVPYGPQTSSHGNGILRILAHLVERKFWVLKGAGSIPANTTIESHPDILLFNAAVVKRLECQPSKLDMRVRFPSAAQIEQGEGPVQCSLFESTSCRCGAIGSASACHAEGLRVRAPSPAHCRVIYS